MSLTILVPKPETPQRQVTGNEMSGRHYPVAGVWVDNLVQQGKMVMFCALCKNKFNPKKHKYIQWSKTWLAIAKCDGCNQVDRNIYAYIPEADYDSISPDRGRRKGKWALRQPL